jgi:hypothetical protein
MPYSGAMMPLLDSLHLWLKADAIPDLADGAAVATWPDSSPFKRHATQAVAGQRPTYRINQLNGLPIVRFDGVNDVVTTPSFSLGAPVVFAVYKHTVPVGPTASALLWRHSDEVTYATQQRVVGPSLGDRIIWAIFKNPTTAEVTGFTKPDDTAGYSYVTDGRYHVDVFASGALGSSASMEIRRHGQLYRGRTVLTAGAPGVAPAAGAFNVGARPSGIDPWGGDVAEVLVYNRQLLISEIDQVMAYIRDKYALWNATTDVVYVAAASQGWGAPFGPGAGFTVNKPTGTAQNDVMIATMNLSVGGGGAGTVAVTPPTGWVPYASMRGVTGSGGVQYAAWYKVAGAGEPANYTWTLTPAISEGGSMFIDTFRNAHRVYPIQAHGMRSVTTGTDWSITPSASSERLGWARVRMCSDGRVGPATPFWTYGPEIIGVQLLSLALDDAWGHIGWGRAGASQLPLATTVGGYQGIATVTILRSGTDRGRGRVPKRSRG